MPAKKPTEMLQRIRPALKRLADDYYRGNEARGFLHWAVSEVLFEEDLSPEVIADKLIIDGPDDFAIDAYWVDDDSKIIHLFQTKFRAGAGTPIPRQEVDTFLAGLERALQVDYASSSRNEGVQELHGALTQALTSDFSVHMVFATTGSLASRDRIYFERNRVITRELRVRNTTKACRIETEILELAGLYRLLEENEKQPAPSPTAEFHLVKGQYHAIVTAGYNVIDFTVPAKQLVDIFEQHRYDIFRLNPRYYLVRSKINSEISKTIENPSTARIFNVLNNGLTAICHDWRVDPDSLVLHINDFQIVNGCQTTVALDKARARVRSDEAILVDIKVVEAPIAMHQTIARATNTQNRLKYEDFVSTDPVQIRLQDEFRRLNLRGSTRSRGENGQKLAETVERKSGLAMALGY